MQRAILALSEGEKKTEKMKATKQEREREKSIYISDGAHFYANLLEQLRPTLGTSISHFQRQGEGKFKKYI